MYLPNFIVRSRTVGEKKTMRVGSYKIPYNQEYADLSITYFKGDGGGLVPNINRWRGQLNLDLLSLEEVSDMAMYGNSPIGSYAMFKIINNFNLNKAFLSFIISMEESTVFLKLDCTVECLNLLEKDIKSFINTFQYNN